MRPGAPLDRRDGRRPGARTDDVDAAFARAVAAGAEARQAPQDMFWGERHAQVEDPFGHRWSLGRRIREVPHEEIAAVAAALFS